MASKLKLDQTKVKTFARNRATLHVARTAQQVETAAKQIAPIRQPDPPRNTPGGRLRTSVGTKMGGSTYHVRARVGSKLRYAEFAHNPTRPHIIRARRKKMLVIPWENGPQHLVVQRGKWKGYVFLKQVHHPGTRGVRYLTGPLFAIGTRNGFRVVISRTVRT